MRYFLLIVILSFTGSTALAATNDSIVVVANIGNASIEMSRQEIRNLFMGGVLSYELKAITLPPGNPARVIFNTKIVGLTESRIQSYWAQMRFSGRKTPPTELSDEKSLVEYLQSHPGTIAYLPANTEIPVGLTVLFMIQ